MKIPKGIGLGVAVSFVSTIIMAAIGALLLSTEKLGEGQESLITVISMLLASALGAITAIGITAAKRLPVCLATGAGYFLTLLAITALFFGGMYSGVGESGLVIMAGVLSVALLSLNSKKSNKKRRKK